MTDWGSLIFCLGLVLSAIVGFGVLQAHREARSLDAMRRERESDLEYLEREFFAKQRSRQVVRNLMES